VFCDILNKQRINEVVIGMSGLYADIIVDISAVDLDRIFQYRIPKMLINQIVIGMQVSIPFGRGNRLIAGYVVNITEKLSYDESKIKDISGIINQELTVESRLIQLAYKIKNAYGATMLQALKTVVPVKRQIKAIETKFYHLKLDQQALADLYKENAKNKRNKARSRLLAYFFENKVISRAVAVNQLKIPRATLEALIKDGVIEELATTDYRNPIKNIVHDKPVANLSSDQMSTVDDISRHFTGVHLIHGITGSGKTEVYIELIDRMIRKNKQVIMLIPEISLTMQTVGRFYARFGERVSIMNSRLSAGERYDQYLRAKRGDVDIIIGPRSALFMPFSNLGMIIMDEEHDGAYKSESMPKYHARDVANWRIQMSGGCLVLGSATPSVESYKKALDGEYKLHELTKRAKLSSYLPIVSIVDLREEFRLKNKKIFSRLLFEKISEKLEKKEQIILFLNRRGYAGFVSCRNCGYVLKCKHCDVSLTSHNNGCLKCHYCGYEEKSVKVCPNCGSGYIAAFGMGTQKVEKMVKECFPKARVLRLDRDSTSKKDSMEGILKQFRKGQADILVGTQMIVKGHDFPDVTLVGILAADLSMFSNDYMAGERTFQLLTQAAGRAGRGDKLGEVVVQTYNPEHYSIVSAGKQDYIGFYQQEIAYRQLMRYPPIVNILVVLTESPIEKAVDESTKKLKEFLSDLIKTGQDLEDSQFGGLELIGPASAYISKTKDIYRRVLYIKHESYNTLVMVKDNIENNMDIFTINKQINIQFDFNPMTIY